MPNLPQIVPALLGLRRSSWAATLVVAALALAGLAVVDAQPAQAAIEFKGPIQWLDWDAGLKLATAKKKPMLMLMHTDACPKCTLLGHVFNNNKDVQKLAKSLVMVHIDGGRAPMPLMQRFGVTSTCRASFALYNTMEEVDALAEALSRAEAMFS